MVGQMQEILSYEIPSYDGVGCASALFGATITLACTAPMRTLALPPDLNSLLNSVHSGHDLVAVEVLWGGESCEPMFQPPKQLGILLSTGGEEKQSQRAGET